VEDERVAVEELRARWLAGRWYDHVQRAAYQNLDEARLSEAVALAEQLACDPDAETFLRRLDAQSLAWRGKEGRRGQRRQP